MPQHMVTKKPLNINDDQVFDGMTRDEKPMSHPTVMSYSLHRIRLAEVARNMIDRSPLSMTGEESDERQRIIDTDIEIQALINDIPTFFAMTKSELVQSYQLSFAQAENILHQRSMIHLFVYAQRCRLHLPYFTLGFTDPAHLASRKICVECARLIIQSEISLQTCGRTSAARCKLAGLVIGVFMACIVLLMEWSVTKLPRSENHEDTILVTNAFHVLEVAKKGSDVARKFVDTLTKILRKRGAPTSAGELVRNSLQSAGKAQSLPLTSMERLEVTTDHNSLNYDETSGIASHNTMQDISGNEDLSYYFNEMAEGFEQGLDAEFFDWSNVFTDLSTSLL